MKTPGQGTDTPKRCFVVMGFGTKTDYATGRKLDLNKSYRLLIKPVVEEKGLICVRADEIKHSGSIDLQMYSELLKADVVIADLSTANVNAVYELGIRHALRPYTTVIISEDKLVYPFDLNHITIMSYAHLGDAIDYEEVERFRKVLGNTLQTVLDKQEPDSPVYTFINKLIPPSLQEQIDKATQELKEDSDANNEPVKALSLIIEEAEAALAEGDFVKAKSLFNSALVIGKTETDLKSSPSDSYLVQSLALATYKAGQPDKVSAMYEGLTLLKQLDLDHTNDPATVSLAGSIEKKLHEAGEGETHLSSAILYFQRGYYLLNNRYNAINLAFTLNCRANSTLAATKEEQIADMVYANYARKRVLELCDKEWNDLIEREKPEKSRVKDKSQMAKQTAFITEQKFWITVNRAEAYFGLGNFKAYKAAKKQAASIRHADWMMEAFEKQIDKLGEMLKKKGHLLNPKWVEK